MSSSSEDESETKYCGAPLCFRCHPLVSWAGVRVGGWEMTFTIVSSGPRAARRKPGGMRPRATPGPDSHGTPTAGTGPAGRCASSQTPRHETPPEVGPENPLAITPKNPPDCPANPTGGVFGALWGVPPSFSGRGFFISLEVFSGHLGHSASAPEILRMLHGTPL